MSNSSERKIIAIDGPSASGKSTVSRQLAQRLDYVYVDSGSFYRGLTWKALQEGLDVSDAGAVLACMKMMKWEMLLDGNSLTFEIDGVNPGDEIRNEPVREKVSYLAALPEVRQFVVEQLQATVEFGSIVMEGRDIGSVVFPGTPYKYYLDADPAERARRRNQEIHAMEGTNDVEAVMDSLKRRDKIDSTRKTAPLQIPLGATVVNSTSMEIKDVVDVIIADIESAESPH